MILATIVLHGVVAACAPGVARRFGTRVFLFCALAPLVTLGWYAAIARGVLDGRARRSSLEWAPSMSLGVDLRVDAFACLFVLLVSGVGVLVFLYSASYFSHQRGLGRFAAILTVFAGSMVGVVVSDNLLSLFVFWELTSVTSYLLIGFDDRKPEARAAALQALLVTGAGGLALLAGLVVLAQQAGTYSLSELLANPPSGTAVDVALVLVLIGAFTKSAQVPFHSWLPGAMAAPTPVSAYLHSATMVKVGVYLVARFSPAFVDISDVWRPLAVTVGLVTMFVGGLRALRQHDLKLLMAYSTVSQLGLLFVLFGMGTPALTFVGVGMLLAHALFKAALFLVVGIVDHEAHTRDIRELRGLARRIPSTTTLALLATGSMVGLPPLFGFAVKEAMYEELLHDAHPLVVAGVVAGSVLTFAYGMRFVWGAFFQSAPGAIATPAIGPHAQTRPAKVSTLLIVPVALLSIAGVGLGAGAGATAAVVRDAARALDVTVASPSLYLWHGFSAAVVHSIIAIVGGTLLFVWRRPVEAVQARLAPPVRAQGVYDWSTGALNRVAYRTTAIVQNGSLPIYIGVILLTATLVPGWVLVTRSELDTDLVFAESPLQVLVTVLVLASAAATAVATRRFVGVMCLGATGLGVAMLYVIQGAPDLALTQLLIETIVLVIFVLVLRHLPERFDDVQWRAGRALRVGVALTVGSFFGLFTVIAASVRADEPISTAFLERALPEGGGRNVVNVILTDFRALDTLGEITVLAVAALGIASLVRAGRPHRGDPDAP